MAAILAALTGAGVARRDVRTTLLSVQPRYDYRDGKAPALTGYDLANVVEVTVRDLGALGCRGRRGADGRCHQPRWPDLPGRRSDARPSAPPGPRRSARRAHGPTCSPPPPGCPIAGVDAIVEGGAPPAWPQPKAARLMAAADAATPIEAGSTEIAVTVTVTFRTA